jgi:fused signal recognition particle receptor
MSGGRGFFGRLFGGGSAPDPAAAPAEPARAEPVVDEAVAADPAEAVASAPAEPEVAAGEPAEASAETATERSEAEPEPIAEALPEVVEPEVAVAEPPAPTVAEPVPSAEEASPPAEPAPIAVVPPAAPEAATRRSWWQRLKGGLSRTSSALGGGIGAIFTKRRLDEATLEEFEDILIQADLGLATATRITEALRRDRFDREVADHEVRTVLAGEVEKVLVPVARPLALEPTDDGRPRVVLVVGVNGSGKTTTIGKLAMRLAREGRRVTLAAGDTFRAAAIEQLKIWGARTGAEVVAGEPGADAAGLAFDAVVRARATGSDVVVIDTAGRLQNRSELMAELEKIVRVLRKQDPTAPHDVILTLDATTGQNALAQVEIFGRVAGVTGLVMTKLDGTARGGILVAIAEKFGLPVHFIGVGEGIDDLEPFDAADFARAIAGLDDGPDR